MRTYANGTIARTGPKPKSKSDRQIDLDKKFGKAAYHLIKYSTNEGPAKLRHKCGNVLNVGQFNSIIRGLAKCKCEHKHKFGRTAKEYKAEIREIHGDAFTLVKYVGIKDNINTYRHTECGKTFERSFNSFRLTKYCPHCAGSFAQNINRVPLNKLEARLNKKFGKDTYTIIGEYKSARLPVTIRHSCGYECEVIPASMLRWKHPVCDKCIKGNNIANFKTVRVDGKEFKVQGFEPKALKFLAKKHGSENVVYGIKNVRRFKYRFKGKQSNYYPDFMIKNTKLVVEVKSLATLGLTKVSNAFFGEDVYERNCVKAKTVIKAGYKFQMRLYSPKGKKRIKLPSNWYDLSKKKLATQLNLSL